MPKPRSGETRDALGVIPFAVIGLGGLVYQAVTTSTWYTSLSEENKALLWTNAVTAGATLLLSIVTLVAVIVAYGQFTEFKRNAKVRATTDLLREWSKPKLFAILDFMDFGEGADGDRRFARLLYRFVYSDETKPEDPKKVKAWREKMRASRDVVYGGIEDVATMVSRTWNLLEHDVIDEAVLFAQLDYYILAAYYTLEDVLAMRQVQDDLLYSEFTKLARAAQKHYKKRPHREQIDAYADARFDDLPFEEDEFERYTEAVKQREAEASKTATV